MHFKETVSILSLRCELNQIKNVKILNSVNLPPRPPKPTSQGNTLFENLIYPLLTHLNPLLHPLKKKSTF